MDLLFEKLPKHPQLKSEGSPYFFQVLCFVDLLFCRSKLMAKLHLKGIISPAKLEILINFALSTLRITLLGISFLVRFQKNGKNF